MEKAQDVSIDLVSMLGQQVTDFPLAGGRKAAGQHVKQLPLSSAEIATGLYFLRIKIDDQQQSFKISIVK